MNERRRWARRSGGRGGMGQTVQLDDAFTGKSTERPRPDSAASLTQRMTQARCRQCRKRTGEKISSERRCHRAASGDGGLVGTEEKRMAAVGRLADGALQGELSTAVSSITARGCTPHAPPRLHSGGDSSQTDVETGQLRDARDASGAVHGGSRVRGASGMAASSRRVRMRETVAAEMSGLNECEDENQQENPAIGKEHPMELMPVRYRDPGKQQRRAEGAWPGAAAA